MKLPVAVGFLLAVAGFGVAFLLGRTAAPHASTTTAPTGSPVVLLATRADPTLPDLAASLRIPALRLVKAAPPTSTVSGPGPVATQPGYTPPASTTRPPSPPSPPTTTVIATNPITLGTTGN